MIRAILLASATVTSMRGLRASICSSHEPFGAPQSEHGAGRFGKRAEIVIHSVRAVARRTIRTISVHDGAVTPRQFWMVDAASTHSHQSPLSGHGQISTPQMRQSRISLQTFGDTLLISRPPETETHVYVISTDLHCIALHKKVPW